MRECWRAAQGLWVLLAVLIYALIALSLTGPALTGERSLLPEGFLDKDLLYARPDERAVVRPFEDSWPVVSELGRERAVAAGLHEGRFDTWNPWAGAGAPLWAEQGGPFFPTKAIYYLSPSHFTLTAALGSRLIVGALGMFLLAFAMGLSPALALFTGALLEYSGAFAANLPYSNTSAIYLLPWAFLGAHKLCTTPGPAAVGLSGLALGIAALGGHPSMILLVYLGFGAWVVGECARRRPLLPELKRVVGLLLATGVIAFLVGAVGLLPFLELVAHGFSYKDADVAETIWREHLGWARDASALAAFFPSLVSAARDTIPDHMWPWAESGSIGLAGLFLAAVGMRKLKSHWGIALAAMVGVVLTLAPLGFQWFHKLPVVRIILPWYCYPLIVVPACLAAGFGLQAVPATSRKYVVRIAIGLALIWLACLAFMYVGRMEFAQLRPVIITRSLFQMVLGLDIPVDPLHFDIWHPVAWQAFLSPLAAALAIAAAMLLHGMDRRRAVAAIAVIALVEAAAIRIPTMTFERSTVLRSGPGEATAELQTALASGLWRFVGLPPFYIAAPNSGIMFGLRDLRSFSALPIRRLTEFLDLTKLGGEDPWKHAPSQYPATIATPVLSLAAVKYIAYADRHRDEFEVPSDVREIHRSGELVFLDNPYAMPRIRVVHDVVPVLNEQESREALRMLVSHAPDGGAPAWTRATVIEGATEDEVLRVRARQQDEAEGDSAVLVSEPDPQRIVIDANLARPGFLVVADAFYPGWSATVDGLPSKIYPANLLFRAVYVPEGRHTIVMKYSSSWLGTGAVMSAAGMLIVAVLFAWRRWSSSRRQGKAERQLAPNSS